MTKELNLTANGVNLFPRPAWNDIVNPAVAQNLQVVAGRIDYDFDRLAVGFDVNARYPDEPLGIVNQMPHSAVTGTEVRPHIHWLQTGPYDPNWMIQWRVCPNGSVLPAWSVANIAKWDTHVFAPPGVGVTILQITRFPTILPAFTGVSGILDIRLFRDTTNASGLFTGTENTNIQYVKEFDIHIQLDTVGSGQEYAK